MRYIPPVKKDGTSSSTEQPEFDRATISLILAVIVAFFAVGFWPTISILIVLTVITGITAWWLKRLFGGHTGELHGALQQISEICVVLTIAALDL